MEARPPAENRHGGAPRGERPASWDAPRLTSAEVAPRKRDNNTNAPVGAPPAPHWVGCEEIKTNPGAERAAGTKNTALFDIVSYECTRRTLCAVRPGSRAPMLSCPGRA